jgi:abequosyltransferase
MTKLSICIPTYNFGKFIGQTLDSIIANLAEGVEVVILDGGSTDNTTEIVAQKTHGIKQIHYHRQAHRGGIDRDIAKAVSLSAGEYCWLFSADDIMKPGAVNKVLNALSSKSDIYLCEHTLCTFELEPIEEYPIFKNISAPEVFDLGREEDRKRYFSNARTSEAFFSFLSGPVFRRDVWEKAVGIPDSFYETCWALAGRLLSMVPDGLVVHFLAENMIYKRGENDSFLDRGIVHRLHISVDCFTHIAETIFGRNSEETFHIRRVVRNERSLLLLFLLKLQVITSPGNEDIAEMYAIVSRHYSNAGICNRIKYVIFRIMPVFMINVAIRIRKALYTYIIFHKGNRQG